MAIYELKLDCIDRTKKGSVHCLAMGLKLSPLGDSLRILW